MIFEAWLRKFIQQHPIKAAAPSEPAAFTAEVMARVRELPQPVLAQKPMIAVRNAWFALPRLSFALAAAAVAVVLVAVAHSRTMPGRLAGDILQGSQVLAAFSDGEPLLDNDIEALADDVNTSEGLMRVAENQSSPEDAGWIEQMSQVLDQLDEDAAANTDSDPVGSSWQDELEMLDDEAASAKS